MLSPDEVTQTTDALEQLPRNFDRRSAVTERRHNILQQKQTDALPALPADNSNAKLAWRQVTQLREENKHLQSRLNTQRDELEQWISKYNALKNAYEREIAVIHSDHQSEITQYRNHLQEAVDERNRLREAQEGLEQRYQDLSTTFQHAVEEEVHQRIEEIARGMSLAPDQAPDVLRDVVKELGRQAKEEGDKYLAQVVYLKREVKRLQSTLESTLEQERQQIAAQRQELYARQHSMREQAELRQKTLHDRLYARWRVASLLTALGLMALLVVLQLICLSLLHVPLVAPVAFALIVPIVICIVCAFVFTQPVTMLHHMFKSVPQQKKVKKR